MGYSIHHNSTDNSRGTAILVSNRLSIVIEDSFRDDECNILLLKVRLGDISLTLGSIYGPNTDNQQFFRKLSDEIQRFNTDFVIISGDWNTTYDMSNARTNRCT